MVITTNQMKEIFGITSASTPTEWRKKGAKVAYMSKNKWDLGKLVSWWAENIYFPRDNPEIKDHRERYEAARADKWELEVARLRSEMMPKQAVTEQLREYLSIAVGRMYILPNNAPVFLEGKLGSMASVIKALEHAVKEICDGIAESATMEQIEDRIAKI
jgi:hypothetical protein